MADVSYSSDIWYLRCAMARLKLIIVSSEMVAVQVLLDIPTNSFQLFFWGVEWCAAGWLRSDEIVTRDGGCASGVNQFFSITLFLSMLRCALLTWYMLSITGLMFGGAQRIRTPCSRPTRLTYNIWSDPSCPWACWSSTTVFRTDVG